jgi:hypothetical protein
MKSPVAFDIRAKASMGMACSPGIGRSRRTLASIAYRGLALAGDAAETLRRGPRP